jgi:antitoxin YefM
LDQSPYKVNKNLFNLEIIFREKILNLFRNLKMYLTNLTGLLYGSIGGRNMAIHTTYTQARNNFAALCDKAIDDCEVIYIERKGKRRVALIDADELSGLLETAYLLKSPANAKRLKEALAESKRKKLKPRTLKELKREVGLE